MEQTKRGRAIAHAFRTFENLLRALPSSNRLPSGLLLEEVPQERCSISSFVNSNTIIEKCIVVLSELIEEANRLAAEGAEQYFPALLFYSEEAISCDAPSESDIVLMMSTFLPTLLDISAFVSRVNEVFRNLLQQIRLFHIIDDKTLPFVSDRLLLRAWKALGELLSVLLQMDEIYLCRPVTKQHWLIYKKAIESVQHFPSKFEVTTQDLIPLLSNLTLVEGSILSGNGLRNCYEQCYGELDEDNAFAARMKSMILLMYQKWEKATESDVPEKKKLMAIVSLTVFYHLHFSQPDTKVIKTVWGSHKKIMNFYLFADILWSPCIFMMREVSNIVNIVDKKSQTAVQKYRQTLLTEPLVDEAVAMSVSAKEWMLEMSEEVSNIETVEAAKSLKISELFLRGVRLADTMSRLLKMILYGPSDSLKLSKKMAFDVFEIIECVKQVSSMFLFHWRIINEAVSLASQQWRCHIISILERLKYQLREANDFSRGNAVDVAINSITSSANRARLTVCGVSLEVSQYDKILKSNDIIQIEGLLTRIHTLLQPLKLVQRVCDCSFIIFQRRLFDIYWETILDRLPNDLSIRNFITAQTDCLSQLHRNGSSKFFTFFQDYLYELMRKSFLLPLCGFVENDLRVLTHKHLSVADTDKTSSNKLIFLKRVLKNPVIPLFNKSVSVKEFIEAYLEKTFYDLTTVSLHDCHTYSKMALLAEDRFGLQLISGDLPYHSIDQGLDMKHVILTLPQFTTNFNYCINHQIFLEKTSANKTLRVVTSDHMTASLRTHGTGILNTSVNIVYQLLRSKFSILAQFLSDEHIRAQLQRDRRHFQEKKEHYNLLYPVKRAEKFNKTIEKLGEEDEESYMDKFRELITQIGNALGFVRSMSSAAYAINSQMREYDSETWMENTDIVNDDKHDVIETLNNLLTEAREFSSKDRNYMKMLIDVFHNALNSSKFTHLENFFMLVPPLTLNYLQHMLTCRERLKKRAQASTKEMTFVDDGFLLGIAYLLTVLSQWKPFLELKWMESLKKKIENDGAEMTSKLAETRDRRSDALMANIVNSTYREYQQMTFTFHSARVFFSFDELEVEE